MKIRYREDFQAWWPNYDHAPEKNFALVQRNLTDIDVAVRYCQYKRTAVQAGGHAGFWPQRLSQLFDYVWSFECEPLLFECMRRNCDGIKNLQTGFHALGDSLAPVKMKGHCSAGSWRIDPEGEHEVAQITIDSLGLTHVDAIFLDIEGYEVNALKGAAETIQRCQPVIMVEELPRSRVEIANHLGSIGYRAVKAIHKDRVYVPIKR